MIDVSLKLDITEIFMISFEVNAGTDDDLPPSHNSRVRNGQVAANGRSIVGSVPFTRKYTDMESEIHQLEQEAYISVLRAFKAQSDALTWVYTCALFACFLVPSFCIHAVQI